MACILENFYIPRMGPEAASVRILQPCCRRCRSHWFSGPSWVAAPGCPVVSYSGLSLALIPILISLSTHPQLQIPAARKKKDFPGPEVLYPVLSTLNTAVGNEGKKKNTNNNTNNSLLCKTACYLASLSRKRIKFQVNGTVSSGDLSSAEHCKHRQNIFEIHL